MESKALDNVLEHQIFNETNLKMLKKKLKELATEKSNEKEIFTLFIKYLVKIFKGLSENLPFYLDQILMKQEIEDFSEGKIPLKKNNEEYTELKSQLREKDEFLEQMAEKIQRIYTKITTEK